MPTAEELQKIKQREQFPKTMAIIENDIISLENMQFKGYTINMQQLFQCSKIAIAYDMIKDYENANIYAEYVCRFYKDIVLGDNRITMVYNTCKRELESFTLEKKKEYLDIIFQCLAIRARPPYRRVDESILAYEYFRHEDDKFYKDRRNVFIKLGIIQDLQDVADKKIIKYMLNAPPGIGKTILITLFMCLWYCWYPRSKELLGTADAELAGKFYNGIVEMVSSNEYAFNSINKNRITLITESQTNSFHFDVKKKEPRFTSKSVGVGATGAVHLNAEDLMVIDDAVPGMDEARNQDTLNKIYANIKQTFLDRKTSVFLSFIAIGTPWRKGCPLYQLEKKYENDVNFRLRRIPAYKILEDGTRESNFLYDNEKCLDMAYWDEQIETDTAQEDYCVSQAKYMMRFISKEGNPFIDTTEYTLKEFEERKRDEPYVIYSATDVATAIGRDYLASGYFYYFENTGDVYLRDIVYSNKGSDYTLPKIVEKHMIYKPIKSVIEEKQGENKNKVRYGITKEIQDRCIKQKLVCTFKVDSGAGKATKRGRIEPFEEEIKGNNAVRGWRFLFLCTKDRKTMPEYNLAMEHLADYFYETKKKDDFPDMLSICAIECIATPKKQKARALKFTW